MGGGAAQEGDGAIDVGASLTRRKVSGPADALK